MVLNIKFGILQVLFGVEDDPVTSDEIQRGYVNQLVKYEDSIDNFHRYVIQAVDFEMDVTIEKT